MFGWWEQLVGFNGFMPHGTCYSWQAAMLWLHISSDGLIILAYYSIPFALWYFVRRRSDLMYRWVFVLFGIFIFLCGTTHLLNIWTIWHPDYLLDGLVKFATALASVAAAVLIWPLLPKLLALPSPAQLLESNRMLEATVEQHKQIERELFKLSRAMEFSSSMVLITDAKGRIEYCNEAFLRVTQYRREEVKGRNPNFLQSGFTDAKIYRELWQTILAGENWHGEILDRKKNGELVWCLQSISPIKDERQRVTHFVSVAQDISERKNYERTIKHLAYYDPLTKLPNRYLFAERLQQALLQTKRYGVAFAVLYLDLDRFKNINDTLGHVVGDKLLVDVGKRLQRILREEDTVARMGGDEFAVLLKNIDSATNIAHIANEIIGVISMPYCIDECELFISTSVGISLCPRDSDNGEHLVKQADTALYEAKARGRNKYEFYNERYAELAAEKLRLEHALRHAVKRDELRLYYQPKLNTLDRETVSLEALLRWQHPQLGLVLPDKFINVAEETGQIIEIGEWVLATACRQMAKWQEAKLNIRHISINLSLRQLRDPLLLNKIDATLVETGLASEALEFEITESTIMDSAEKTSALLAEFKARKLRLAIDDFGTGYSSLSYLKRFPVQTLKIDRSFVRDITSDPEDAAIVTAVIGLAKNLGLCVVAEGVETDAQLNFLTRHGCDEIQGNLLSEPLPTEKIPALLQTITEQYRDQ
ncbi:MAG: putative bifunctional diguanylate cyclase/phosphodiesterase [Gammaproteobacteria bacterium]